MCHQKVMAANDSEEVRGGFLLCKVKLSQLKTIGADIRVHVQIYSFLQGW